MRTVLSIAMALAVATSMADSRVSLSGYAPGERLSDRGAVGGAWCDLPESAVARIHRDRPAIGVGEATGLLAFAQTECPTGDVTVVEFSVAVEEAEAGLPEAPDGVASLTLSRSDAGEVVYLGWGDGAWNELAGEDVPAEPGAWIDGRFEVRFVAGRRLVSYLVRRGPDWVRLATRQGQSWFLADAAALEGRLSFWGEGCFSDFSSTEGVSGETFAVDCSRPRVGAALTADVPSFLLDSGCRLVWRRGDWAKNYADEPVATTSGYAPVADDYAHWLRLSVLSGEAEILSREAFFSKLPVCYLTTDDGAFPSAEKEEHAAALRIQGNDAHEEQYDGATSVKVRGNTSAGYPKKPYKLKLDKKSTLCGLGTKKSKHWVLLANMPDMSQMRNKLAFDFANGHTATFGMKSTWVDVVFNGRYDGVYLLAEHVRVAEDRVNVFDWEGYSEDNGHTAEDLSWIDADATDVKGGWLFEFSSEMDEVSRFTVRTGKLEMKTMVGAPEFLKTNPRMLAAAQDYLTQYFTACTAANRRSPEGLGYGAYADVDSMVGYFLVQELFGNQDACAKSRYAMKDLGRKLVWGPVWDFDHAAGTSNMQQPSPERWHAAQGSVYCEWLSDSRFARRARAAYRAIRDAYSELADEGGTIDAHAAYLVESAAANDARWRDSYLVSQRRTFAEDVAVLKAFINGHRAWLDAQFATLETLIGSTRCDAQTNPCERILPEPTTLLLR